MIWTQNVGYIFVFIFNSWFWWAQYTCIDIYHCTILDLHVIVFVFFYEFKSGLEVFETLTSV